MRVCTLASGSSGNSLYIESSKSKILVDAGIGPRVLKKRLESIDVDLNDVDAVIVTHEHEDHTRALPKIPMQVYVAEETEELWKGKVQNLCKFDTSISFNVGDFYITPFSVPHDARDPVGFTVEFDNIKLGLVTDLGDVTGLVVERLKRCNVLVLESNHDTNLLFDSSYPWDLKQRIKGRLGHLSNIQSSKLLNTLFHKELRYVILAHLSQVNNKPEVAYTEAMKVINRNDSDTTKITVAPRQSIGEVINL